MLKNKVNRGFTLIELLAVIVILAIIALIATPIVLDIIEDSKESSIKRSAELYLNGVEQAIARYQLNGKEVTSGTYYVMENGNICTSELVNNTGEEITITVDGTKPSSGTITINKGEIESINNLYIDKKYINRTNNEMILSDEAVLPKTYSNGEVVYFDVDTGKSCDTYTETQSNTGVKSGCMKFYAFNDEGKDTLNLILDHNTTAILAWNLSGSNQEGPKELLEQLKNDTDDWKGTITPENYTMDQSSQDSGANYTVDYSNYKARLITANEIAKITGNKSFDEVTASSYYYLDSLTQTRKDTCKSGDTSGCSYGWLYDRTNTSCTKYGCLNNSDVSTYGYWTVSSYASDSGFAWRVDYSGFAGGGDVGDDIDFDGVRPVITILKSQL